AEDGIRDFHVTGVQTCALPIFADQRELSLANGRGSLVPDLVGEVSIGSDDVHFGTGLLELGVAVGSVFDFSWAVEGESCRHEDRSEERRVGKEGRVRW